VAEQSAIVVGQQVEAVLVPNTMQPERTPWLAAQINLLPPMTRPQIEEVPTIEKWALEALREGGEWTIPAMAEHLAAGPKQVAEALETIYNKDLCSKYQLWRKRSDTEPSDEWFTCHPEDVEFVTGVE
jgi:hypothetical protein